MQNEAWASIPRDKRPTPESLVGYKSVYADDPEPDYDSVLIERGIWIGDYQRETEQNRERDADGGTPLPGHDDPFGDAPGGYDEETFSLSQVVRQHQQRPRY